jgi:hypothetical protein
MKLSEDQLISVAAWFAGGASLDVILKRLVSEFGVHVTYFDLRMIVADLPQPEEEGEDAGETPATPNDGDATPNDADATPNDGEPATPNDAEPTTPEEAPPDGEAASSLTVTVDALMIPGTMASGDVVFSDGVKGKWYLDQMGRLGLGGDLPQGYRPSPADAALFQARLMEALRAKGLC